MFRGWDEQFLWVLIVSHWLYRQLRHPGTPGCPAVNVKLQEPNIICSDPISTQILSVPPQGSTPGCQQRGWLLMPESSLCGLALKMSKDGLGAAVPTPLPGSDPTQQLSGAASKDFQFWLYLSMSPSADQQDQMFKAPSTRAWSNLV